VDLPELDIGTAGHDQIAQEVERRLTKEELKKRIEAGKATTLLDWQFEGTCRKVLIKGIPDYLEIKGQDANLLVEFKFSKQKRMFKSYRVQLNTYGFLLHKNKLHVDNLICAAAVFPVSEMHLVIAHQIVILKMKKFLTGLRTKTTDKAYFQYQDIFCYLYPFSLEEAKEDINWAMDYWLKERRPKPTTKSYKCKVCSYNLEGLCSAALDQ
jgi:hypothetical protein